MNRRKAASVLAVAAIWVCGSAIAQEEEFRDSADHPELPRTEGTRIAGYSYAEYDAGRFVTNDEARNLTIASPEGRRTRIIYVGQNTQSSLQIFRNYQKAFAAMGEVREVYACQRDQCWDARIGTNAVWSEDNRIPNDLGSALHYSNTRLHKDPMYFHGTVTKGEKLFHVSVFTALVTNDRVPLANNRPTAHVEVLEVEDFEATLEFVDAKKMTSRLKSDGHVALYGILFDFDSASLQNASMPTIAEIARTMRDDPSLSVFVVGHTDGEGDPAYNQDLSRERATSVVNELADNHGIDVGRLVAAGVGPLAPVSSNDTDEGRAMNRRVEIVSQYHRR